jgi:putative OPT family oligopeptide transporter
VPGEAIAGQLVKLGYLKDVAVAGAYGWDPVAKEFAQLNRAIYFAYVRQIGAGMVAAGGFITLIKTIPTIISAFKGAVASMKGGVGEGGVKRTENDLPLTVVIGGCVGLIAIVAALPFIPGSGIFSKLLLGVLMIIFGFFFVTVSSRIVGIIGSSSNPISGMTIAALMATCLIFVGMGWTGDVFQPMALCVGGMVCIAAANAGATSQDLKTGYLVGATPRSQQIGLMIGAVAAAVVIGLTMKVLDNPTLDVATGQMVHAIGGDRYPAPQGTLMATLIKGLLAHNLDWQFVLVGVFFAITMELCGVRALAFAVGAYLPLSTTLPIFIGGVIRWFADRKTGVKSSGGHGGDEELGPGNLFATGLVAGGALAGVFVAILVASSDKVAWLAALLKSVNVEEKLAHALGHGGFDLLGVAAFTIMGAILFKVALRPAPKLD